MKLSQRTLLLIIPAVLLSAALSSYIIYLNQKQAIIRLERSSIELKMEKLASHYRQADAFLDSYAYTLANTPVLQRYFTDTTNPYREVHLSENLTGVLKDLARTEQGFAALALLDHQANPLLYVDNGTDPFSAISPGVRDFINQSLTSDYSDKTVYLYNNDGSGLLVRFDTYDRRTFQSPLGLPDEHTLIVAVMTSSASFDALLHDLELEHHTVVTYSSAPPEVTQTLTYSVMLDNGIYATIDPASFLLNQRLDRLLRELLIAFGLSSALAVMILLTLFFRYVIRPITHLDTQLREVETNHRTNIEVLNSNDEIGNLSQKFHQMYQELTDSFQQTKELADSDQLTRLANRRHFHNQVVERTEHLNKELHSAWLMYVDLDNFKFVNDKYGHKVGDIVLVHFAQQLTNLAIEFQQRYHTMIFASRLSGDEFAVYLDAPLDHRMLIHSFCDRILLPMQNGLKTATGTYPITASIGIASWGEDGDSIEKLLSRADTAMYQAKDAGKNRYAFYSPELDAIIRRNNDIERALREQHYDDEFYLVYMPLVDRNDTHVAGVEALLRWDSPKLGFVSPDEFIPIAEKTGLFEEIDRWVIRQAFKEFHHLQRQFSYPVQVSVNLSSAELNYSPLADFITEEAMFHSVPHHLVAFEITETFAANSQDFPLLHELDRLGFPLAIDDFGSGYTSFTQLVRYPIQKIKLDRQFLISMLETSKGHIIKPLIELCHSEKLYVTAEGVENHAMYQWLRDSGCDYMQGYHFGKPMKIEELHQWQQLRQERKSS